MLLISMAMAVSRSLWGMGLEDTFTLRPWCSTTVIIAEIKW